MTLRILHTESSPSLGGQELRILLEMEALAARGYDSVLVARPGTPILAEAQRRGLRVYGVPLRSSLDLPSMIKLALLMRRHRIDVVNAHNSKDGWNAALVARMLSIPVIRSRHIASRIRTGYFSRLIYGPLCDVVMTTGRDIGAGLVERGVNADRIEAIPTGIDPDRFANAQPGALRVDLGIPAGATLIGQIAVLRGDKGPEYFVRAAQQLLSEGFDAWFVLVGEGPARKHVEAQLAAGGHASRIKLAGFRRDIPAILADLDLFVLAARSPEGVPQAILQAHAARVPVVATTVGGVREVAIHEETALCTAPRDVAGLASAMRKLIEDRELASQLAERGHRMTREHYSLNLMLERMDRLYRRLAASRRR
ncbi:MAG: glycosyltransferase family 4 protein [Pseudomonadota bacterium]